MVTTFPLPWPVRPDVRFPMLVAILLLPALSTARGQDQPTAAELDFFERRIRPILVTRCFECHAADETNGGLSVESRQQLLDGGDTGPAIVPGAPEKSRLIEAVGYENRDLQMPPRNRLPQDEISALKRWVAMGAPDPRRPGNSAPAPTGMSIEEGRTFWSFRPPTAQEIPPVKNPRWVKTPIDSFILARLEAAELQPAPSADKRTLIRRATFDLTGLPPTAEEIQAFLDDDSPDAFRRVVDRLLDSPQYGVRWGRHWLDVARYADSNGLDENLALGNAWRYRDYVVNAFNDDKPFNRFLVEQLAGDLLPDATRETKTATGFLVLGAKVLAEPDMEKLVMDTIDEQLDTTGKAFMGMTLGCVRCHDHKFDPLKQSDYYALAAIFKSTRTFGDTKTGVIKHWHEYSFATPEQREKLKKIDAEIAEKKKAASGYRNAAMSRIRAEARQNAVEYLVAATDFEPDMPLSSVAEIAAARGLHPRILHHCRLHLQYHADDPFFKPWHELHPDAQRIRAHYEPLFLAIEPALAAARKANPKASSVPDPAVEEARLARNDTSGFLAVPPKPEFAFDAKTLAEYYRLEEEARLVESSAPDEPAAMGVGEATVLTSLPIHIRGSHLNPGDPVQRRFPLVMCSSEPQPALPPNESGRLQFAEWLTSGSHPLTARVYVNRVWGWHFGRAIVASTENFGVLGDRPTHPELLDWLAEWFVQNGWSTKKLHRLLLNSSAWQMDSVHPHPIDGTQRDPENHLLWRSRIQRLEAEQIRDAVLAVSARLDLSLGGKTVPLRNRQFVFNHTSKDHTRYDSLRRALYLPVIRNNLYTLFEQFDYPDPTMPTGKRSATVVAPQALLLMNSDLVMESADHFAERLIAASPATDDRIRLAYELAFGRLPSEPELRRAVGFLSDAEDRRTWSMFCQGLFAANEFIYLR